MRENPVKAKSFAFALRVVNLAKYLQREMKEFVLSKEVLRSGTAIGALVREAEQAESKADFTHKMNTALKEANETLYWLQLLHQADFIDRTVTNPSAPTAKNWSSCSSASSRHPKGPAMLNNSQFSIFHSPLARTICFLNSGQTPEIVFTQQGENCEVKRPAIMNLLRSWRRI